MTTRTLKELLEDCNCTCAFCDNESKYQCISCGDLVCESEECFEGCYNCDECETFTCINCVPDKNRYETKCSRCYENYEDKKATREEYKHMSDLEQINRELTDKISNLEISKKEISNMNVKELKAEWKCKGKKGYSKLKKKELINGLLINVSNTIEVQDLTDEELSNLLRKIQLEQEKRKETTIKKCKDKQKCYECKGDLFDVDEAEEDCYIEALKNCNNCNAIYCEDCEDNIEGYGCMDCDTWVCLDCHEENESLILFGRNHNYCPDCAHF